ncbi:MAG: hypothetical protein SWX82_30385 [Cyanobacteriota bacterium]|nr:hypothetical protein [Cyanobacteriota bacterium]
MVVFGCGEVWGVWGVWGGWGEFDISPVGCVTLPLTHQNPISIRPLQKRYRFFAGVGNSSSAPKGNR